VHLRAPSLCLKREKEPPLAIRVPIPDIPPMKDTTFRLALRYGSADAPAAAAPNAVIDLLLNHRSVRGYRPDPLPEGALELIVAAAQSAATSSNLQTWSVVEVTDQAVKDRCAEYAGGQKHISECPVFLLFVADLARLNRSGEAVGVPAKGNDTFEMFLVAAIDAALAAQNAVVAAESLGLSTVYIGGMRNRPEETAALVGLPSGAAVVFGLCLGYAAEGREGSVKPRLPQEAVLHRKRYDLEGQDDAIRRYNAAMADFYVREKMNVTVPWTMHSAKRVAGPEGLQGRHVLMQALRRMGFFRAE
jgi:nitroreductase